MPDRGTGRQPSGLKVITLVFDEEGRFQGVKGRNGKLQNVVLRAKPNLDLGEIIVDEPPKPMPIPVPAPPPANHSGECAELVELRVGGRTVAHLDSRL